MFEGQPKGLWALAFANTGERFGYYTMLAVFILFLQANFGWTSGTAGTVYASFLALVYFLPIIGGAAADRWGYSKMVTIGIFIMFLGYVLLAIPMGANMVAVGAMAVALMLVSLGTGLFKGNLQVMVGDLYNDPQYADKRDAGFSLFYMLINVGAMFAPTAAIAIMKWAQTNLGVSEADSYHFAFAVACVSLIVSISIYYAFKSTFAHVITTGKKAAVKTEEAGEEMSAAETTERIICLCLVFAVVIFFWMAFHQNGATLTYFARDFSATTATGVTAMEMDVTNLVACIFIIYGLFGIFQSKTVKGKSIAGAVIALAVIYLGYQYGNVTEVAVDAPIYQQFNPCFVIALTPVSIGLFGWLASKGKEPKAPVKIGLGMLVAAFAYLLMTLFTLGLPAPDAETPKHLADVNPNTLVSIYLILTFAELLLSPIGISFVTKVAPTKYKGLMMGLWFGATAIGNFLVSIPTMLWGNEHYVVWGTLTAICLVAALFIFSVIKKLNKVA
ncbi:MAG: peptide MFS transporter [Bacteroidaceae bacterium]|nr:peptide MFS transporter [Bacteroidaceae bacterium]